MHSLLRLQLAFLSLVALSISSSSMAQQPASETPSVDAEWITLFDGKTLDGWEKVGKDDSHWSVEEGAINGSGTQSMLVYTKDKYKNFRYRVEAKINDGGNSGVYFRTTRKPSFSDGYEAQVDSTHTDPIRTGSLYGFCHVYQQHVKPEEWFTYEIEVRDDVWRKRDVTRIKITVDGNELYEHLDFDQTFAEGHFAFQQHDPGSKVSIRKVEVLPMTE
ncbi:MAG: 3-keto-disaccharide hydrolase [Rubripirellula sp.]